MRNLAGVAVQQQDFTRRPFLQQAFPCMALENLCVPDVTPQRVHALVPRLIGHLEELLWTFRCYVSPSGRDMIEDGIVGDRTKCRRLLTWSGNTLSRDLATNGVGRTLIFSRVSYDCSAVGIFLQTSAEGAVRVTCGCPATIH